MTMKRQLAALFLFLSVPAIAREADDRIHLLGDHTRDYASYLAWSDTNVVSIVNNEINARSTREIVASAMSLQTNQAILPQFMITNIEMQCFRNGADQSTYQEVKFRMYWYAASRLDGHSKTYALENLKERKRETFRDAKLPRDQLLRNHQDCPPSWLKVGPTNAFHVTDSNTVWVYRLSGVISWQALDFFSFPATKLDPKQLEPAFADLLIQVRKEAESNLTAGGVTKQLGYCHALWGEMKNIFREKHGINWRTPAEQNPETIFD